MSINSFIRSNLKFSKHIIILTILTTAFMAWMATKIGIDTDINNTLMPKKNARIEELQKQLGVVQEAQNYIFLSIHGYDLYDLTILQTFQNTIDDILKIPELEAALTPFNFISFQVKNRQILPAMISPTGRAPVTAEELKLFEEQIKESSLTENFVVADNGRVLTAVFLNSFVEDRITFISAFNAAVHPLQELVTVHYTGEALFQERISHYLIRDFSILLILAIIAISIIFWLSFRSMRAVILPLLVVVIGAIWSLGFMALLGYKITVLTVIVPSLVLTIGSSYTIHILNEYNRLGNSARKEKIEWLAGAVEHVLRTIIVAALTTMICFLSLLTTRLKQLQEFGLSISLGIFACAILSLFFLPAILYHLKNPSTHQRNRVKTGWMTLAVGKLGEWSRRKNYVVLVIFISLMIFFFLSYPYILHQSDYFSYFPSDDPIIVGSRFVNRHSGGAQTFNITLTAKNKQKDYFLNPEILQKVDQFETVIDTHPSVTNKLSFNGILKAMNKAVNREEAIPKSRGLILLLYRYFRIIPEDKVAFGQESAIIDKDASLITIYLKLAETETFSMINEDGMRKFLDFVNEEIHTAFGETVEFTLWGNTLLVLDSSRLIKEDQFRSTLISIILGMVIIWLFFHSFIYSIMALIPLLSGIFFYFINLYVFKIPLDMTTILVTNVTVGVGLDDAVHFLLQYRKQRAQESYQQAILSTLKFTGRPIVLTTLSLISGLAVLCFASFRPVMFFGLLIAGTLFSAMIGTVVFIPSTIAFYEQFRAFQKRRSPSSPSVNQDEKH